MRFLGNGSGNRVPRQSKCLWQAALLVLLMVFGVGGVSAPALANSKFAAVTVDARNGKLLFAENADAIRHPASLTKMMTLYVLFQDLKSGKIKLDTPIRMSARAASMAPSKLGVKAGKSITVETAIRALVVKSANDVAAAVAENLSGSEQAFAQRMTRTARAMGMSRTTFANASGLPNPRQVTTARDMATLGLRLMRDFPQYYPYFRTQSFTYAGRTIRGHNRLLGKYEGTDGIKTGYINASGFNLVTSVRRGDKRLVGVVLGGRTGASRDAYMRKMLSQYFDDASRGKTIAALAGSSKGAINPVGADENEAAAKETAVAEARPMDKLRKKAERKKKQKDNSAQAETQVAAAENTPPVIPEQGDTADTLSEMAAEPQEADLAAQAIPSQTAGGSAIKQVEVVPQPEPAAPPTQQPKLMGAGAAGDLPFQVKTPQEQLADQAHVASLPSQAMDAGWMIQLGDFATKQDAQARITDLRRKTPDVLAGKTAQTVVIEKSGRITYRARFAGFDESSAAAACKAINRKKAACTVQAPL